MLIAVTGASGFVGSALAKHLEGAGHQVRRFTRREGLTNIVLSDITDEHWWTQNLLGVDAIVHCAARVHVVRETAPDPSAAFRAVNVMGSAAIARAAASLGIRQLIFLSTIGVHGRPRGVGSTITEATPFDPRDPYAESKLEAERVIKAVAATSGTRFTILRPPLIVGPKAPGNLPLLAKAIKHGIPLPLRGLRNQRTLLSLPDLLRAICRCIGNANAFDQEFLLGGDEPLSTTEIARLLAAALDRPLRTFSCPDWVLRQGASLIGRLPTYEGLYGSLVVDSSKFRRALGWRPSMTPSKAITLFATTFH
jgi:nucleoside-diphosphate-sugar epimerase